MKISIDGKQFKEAVDRAMTLIKGRPVIYLMECIKLIADDSGAYLFATNGLYALQIKLDAHVVEQGEAYVNADDMKKVYAMPGFLSIEAEKAFVVRNGKKRSEVVTRAADRDLECMFVGNVKDAKDGGQLFAVGADALMSMLRATDCARSQAEESGGREVLNGFNFNGGLMKLVALDGYRLHAVKLAVDDVDSVKMNGFNKAVHGDMYAHLKKIIKGKSAKGVLHVHDFGKYMKVIGGDFEYSICYIPGDPLKVEKIIPAQFDFSYRLSVKELSEIVKGYKANCICTDEVGANSMHMHIVNGQLRTGMMHSEIHTMDELEGYSPDYGMNDKYFHSFNVRYMYDALTAIKEYDDDDVVIASGTNSYNMMTSINVHPLLLTHGDMLCLVLPVRIAEEYIPAIKSFMQSDM